MNDIAIRVENLSKAYQLGDFGTGSLTTDIERWWALMRGKEDPFLKVGETNDRTAKGESNIVWSLKDINFDIAKGDAIGIIGRNGAGKSTLLKLLSRVTSPTTGNIKVNGRIASLLEVGTGFHPELTGKENIFLNGAIMGMSTREIKRKFDEIVDFAGVERYIDTPVKRYSSGMYVRLAFAVAAHLDSEILIVDEVLAVGDADFQKKCLGKMNDVSKGEGRTILFVSHNMGAIKELCRNAILLENGRIKLTGTVQETIDYYQSVYHSNEAVWVNPDFKKPITIQKISLINDEDVLTNSIFLSHPFKIVIDIEVFEVIKGGVVALNIHSIDGSHIVSIEDNNFFPELFEERKPGKYSIVCNMPAKFLNKGTYTVRVGTGVLRKEKFMEIDELGFEILNDETFSISNSLTRGYLYPNVNLKYAYESI